ncbi:MAG: S-layer homology domain-containing protein, partial [Oscillospiraceae bacterium]|nr:S-layer homology domain-containing protein [Oscillospiraceae bacterium]
EEIASEVEYVTSAYERIGDAVSSLMRAILESPCAAFLKELLTEEDVAYYLEYEPMTEEELALGEKEAALENEYYQAAASVTVEYEGGEWTDDDAYYAYLEGAIDRDTYDAISTAYVVKLNEVLGEIYLRMVELRKEIAAASGYDNYADYAYETVYQRDYTQEEIKPFHKAVKEGGFYELYLDLNELISNELDMDIYYGDYTGTESLELVESYIQRMSSEMAEAFAYMLKHGLYDITEEENKEDSGYTTMLYSYGAPFFFNCPYGMLYDFTTIVHEFGHYNNFYWEGAGWNDPSSGHDLAEVHSQGLELMFSHWYDEIFEDNAQFVLDFQLYNLVNTIVDGCIHDELQQYVYAEENLTLQKINQKYRQLAAEYGMVPADDPRTEMYGWCQIPHTFASPCYYISYAVSSAGAFSFWLDTQDKEYFDVVDEYLKFVALPADMGFQESFAALGMDNPISPEYMAELAQALRKAMNVDERLAQMAPVDLDGSEWFYEPLMLLFQTGLITTDEDHCIRPSDPALWADAAAVLSALTQELVALEQNGGEPITRGEFVDMLAGCLEITGEAGSPFSDTDSPAVAALAEMGIVNGCGDGTFRPDRVMTRAEMYVVVYRVVMSIVDELMDGVAA